MGMKEDILSSDDLPLVAVPTPEWKVTTVWIRTMSAAERDAFEASNIVRRGKQRDTNFANIRARFVALCACDERGERIFSDADAGMLGNKSAAVLDRLFDAAQKANGVTEDDVKEMAKN